jgi:hypothetical protein
MVKRIYIISGLDNSGKDTVINYLTQILYKINSVNKPYFSVIQTHALKPVYITKKIAARDTELNGYFIQYKQSLINNLHALFYNDIDYLIFNRFYTEEFIYGQLYRGRSEYACARLIEITFNLIIGWLIENEKVTGVRNRQEAHGWMRKNIIFIKTDCPSSFLVKNDDNESLSGNNLALIDKEQEIFNKYIDILRKLGLTVINLQTTKKDKRGNTVWLDKETELKEAIQLII